MNLNTCDTCKYTVKIPAVVTWHCLASAQVAHQCTLTVTSSCLSEAPYKCGVCGIALFAILRTLSHYLSFSALFRTFDRYPHLFALFTSFHTVLHYFCMKTSENNRKSELGSFGTMIKLSWEVLVLWYAWLGEFWHCKYYDAACHVTHMT